MRSRLPVLAFVLALLAAFVVAPTVSAAGYSATGENRLVSLINAEHRRVCGKSLAVRQPYQNRNLARWRAADMLTRNYFSHTIKGTSNNAFDYFRRYGIRDWQAGGEIIAYNAYYGDSNYEAATRAYGQFRGSPTHISVIRTCRYNAVGVGNYVAGGRHYFAVIFTDQPSERVVSRTYIRWTKAGTIREAVEVGWRQYIWQHGYDSRGRRWDMGIFPGRTGWGWVLDYKTR